MALTLNRLSARKVATLETPGYHADGGGLYLQVTPGGAKSWVFRYRFEKRRPEMGLGPAHTVSLAEARNAATNARKQLLAGVDPLGGRKAAKALDALIPVFWDSAISYIESNKSGWKNAKHAEQWINTLETYAKPFIGNLRVDRIDTDTVLEVLNPIWHTKSETASRVRQRMERVIGSAIVTNRLKMENPARWRGHLEVILPKPSKVKNVENFAALPYAELKDFITALRQRKGEAARALEFTILTAARTGMTVGVTLGELSDDISNWDIPADRMKGKIAHIVPLSPAAMALVEPRQSRPLLFPTEGTDDKQLSENAMLAVLKRMGFGHVTVHGFRSTFKQWADEVGEYPDDLSEAALAHKTRDKAKAAYKRGSMLERRRVMMADWAKFCGY